LPAVGKAAVWLALGNFLAMVVLGIIEIALECDPKGSLRCDKWFMDNKAVVLMVGAALNLSNVYNSVCEENFYELVGSFVASFLVTADCAVIIWAKRPISRDLQVIFLLIVAISYQVIVLALAMPLYKVFIRRMHRKIGSDPKTQQYYKHHLLTLTLLKFDVCFAIITIICAGEGIFNVEAGSTGVYRFLAALVCVAICVAWCACGWIGMKRESRVLTWIYFVGFIMAPIYCVVWFIFSPYHNNTIGKRYLVINFIVYACIDLSIHLAVLIASIMRYRQFGHGLLLTLSAEKTRRQREGRADEGFADLDSDEEFDLDISFDTSSSVKYQRMEGE
jgi:hypothetical protein